jgi:hypothetical protein
MRHKNVYDTNGGLLTGPKTAEGIKRIQNAHWKHGDETNETEHSVAQKAQCSGILLTQEITATCSTSS